MFERTASLWRRLVGANPGQQTSGGTATAVHEDRRLWCRYKSDSEATLQLGSDDRVSARVRDISLGGANLVVNRPVSSGQMLTLELPSANGQELQVVLACVVRVVPTGEGEWSVGCVFSRELSPEDLDRLGAEPKKGDAADQRTWVRYPCNLEAVYQPVGADEAKPRPAEVLNVSASGVGLLLREPVEAGTLLQLDLVGRQGTVTRSILACVVHSTRQSDGALAVGCNFIRELAEEELRSLL